MTFVAVETVDFVELTTFCGIRQTIVPRLTDADTGSRRWFTHT
ncbi:MULTISPECIES: hypothetical protein [Nocardia]|nr:MULTISPECIES: hypothetical protein [Nocardia]MCZ9330119.1 hypothetical protein [Nocardia farcinica]